MEPGTTGRPLEVLYKGKNIAQVLDMTCEEAVDFFENLPKIRKKARRSARSAWAISSWARPVPPSPAVRPSG